MKAKDLLDQTPATYDQLKRWIEHGIKIGSPTKGTGHPREFSALDVKVVTILSGLSPLLGSGGRVPSGAKIMKKVATQIRAEPSIADRDFVFVSTTGIITETPKEGWVISR